MRSAARARKAASAERLRASPSFALAFSLDGRPYVAKEVEPYIQYWLDDVLVCRGVCRVLEPGGSFFVVHSVMDLDDAHPLAYLLGNKSILGHKATRPFVEQVELLARRLTLLFDALDAPHVHRYDPAQRWEQAGAEPLPRIVPAAARLFRQERPFDLGPARPARALTLVGWQPGLALNMILAYARMTTRL